MLVNPKLLTLGPMARQLRLPVRWLRAEAEAGRVPCLRAEGAFLFDPAAVESILLRRAAEGDCEAAGQGGAQ
jgi:hypothetical protein